MKPKDINTFKTEKLFSICTLVTNKDEYQEMIDSFNHSGFNESNSEFLYVDNSINNQFDAFQGIKYFLTFATGKYIIICHQDVIIKYDNIENLLECIAEVSLLDPNWAILGNAGGVSINKLAVRISDPHGEDQHIGDLPARVSSLDENFLLIKREANLSISNNIEGFHFYGTDLCVIADILGYTSYVINFHLYHKSAGNADNSFTTVLDKLLSKYQVALRSRRIQTTCTEFYISNSNFISWIMERKLVKSFLKRKI
ncbi:hypothetical protein [Sulfurimonas sp.]|uniref:hypothetical protein n=1 Tax=Sulfurimonas sp. TaxID=2022749 RepID=UPI00356AA1E3